MGEVVSLPRKSAVVEVLEELLAFGRQTDMRAIEFIVEFATGTYRIGAAGRFAEDPAAGLRAAQLLERRMRWEHSMRDTA